MVALLRALEWQVVDLLGGCGGIGRLLVEFGQIGKARFVEARPLDQMRDWYRKEGR